MFSVLGPLEIQGADDADPVVLAPRQRQLVARLLVSPNRVVPTDTILDELWDDPLSAGSRSSLHAQLSRIRTRLLRPDVLEATQGGYRLRVAESDLDVWRFERLLGEGRAAILDQRLADAADRLDAALRCWRGPAFVDLERSSRATAEAVRLDELRRIATLDRIQVDIDRGRPDDALAAAVSMLAEDCYDERAWALRITALYASARQAAALAAFAECRTLLRRELGLDPGLDLQRLERRVLDLDPELGAPGSDRSGSRGDAVGEHGRHEGRRLDLPPVAYASSGGIELAYRVIGEGSMDVTWIPDYLSHLDVIWEHPAHVEFLGGLAAIGRLITYDKRGQGLSQRTIGKATAQERAHDLLRILDAAGSRRAVLVGSSEGAEIATTAAVLAPDRVAALVLIGSGPVAEPMDPDADWSLPMDDYIEWIEWAATRWGTGRSLGALAPSAADDPASVAWYAKLERQTITPAGIVAYARGNAATDYRSLLARVDCPTLVLHRHDDVVPVAAGRFLAEHIPGARYVELDGNDHLVWFGDSRAVLAEIRRFVHEAGARRVPVAGEPRS